MNTIIKKLSAFYFCSSVSSKQSKGQVMHSNT